MRDPDPHPLDGEFQEVGEESDQAAERELRLEQDEKEQEGGQQDDRADVIEILAEKSAEEPAGKPAGELELGALPDKAGEEER